MNSKRIVSSVTNDLSSDQRVHRICSSLKSQGFEVELTGRKKKNSIQLSQRDYSCKRLNLFFEKGPFFYAEFNFRLFLYLLFKRFDVLLANDLDTLPANFLISKIRRKPLVYDSHEYFTEVPELIDRRFTRSLWLMIERICINGANASMTVSNSIATEYGKKYGIEMEVIRNLPKSYDREKLRRSLKEVRDKKDRKIIIYQGSVNVDRGLEEMIQAMQYLPKCLLLICGDGDVFNELKVHCAGLDWNERIEFTGKIPLEDLSAITIQADIGISIEKLNGLSYTYALPNKVFDYLQAGIPALVSSLPEVIHLNNEYGFAHIIEEVEPRKIAEAISTVLDSDEEYARLRVNAENAAEKLNWEKEEPKLFQLFLKVSFQG